jgi:hypothetical protein
MYMRKVLSVILTAILIASLVLTGCGGGGGGGGGSSTGSVQGFIYYSSASQEAIYQSNNKAAADNFQPLAGATVTLTSTSGGQPYTADTANDGYFQIINVPNGSYTLSSVTKASTTITFNPIPVTISSGQTTAGTGISSQVTVLDAASGYTVSLAGLTNKTTYLLHAIQNKKETNDLETSGFSPTPITIGLTNTAAPQQATLSVKRDTINALRPQKSVLPDRQIRSDKKMRELENTFLSKKLRQATSAPKAAQPSIIGVGTVWPGLWVLDTTTDNFVLITAICQKVTDSAYIFVEDSVTSRFPDSLLNQYVTGWNSIYPTNHSKFGNENDVDNNNKVVIVFTGKVTGGALGYFFAGDKYSEAEMPAGYHSNQSDILYVTADTTYINNPNTILGTLAHEFQHMIYFDNHYNKGATNTYTWLNEGLSMLAEYYNGYANKDTDNSILWMKDFLMFPEAYSLTCWTGDYGATGLFVRYLYEQYGDTAIKKLVQTDKIGIAAVEAATGKDFNQVYKDWTWALFLSNTGHTSNAKYNYRTLNLQQMVTTGRKGLQPYYELIVPPGYSWYYYPYQLAFDQFTGLNANSTLKGTGTYWKGTVFAVP